MTLTFKHKNKTYTSNPFDWKAMCLVNEGHNDPDKKGIFMMCDEAVAYMFEGTDGAAVIDSIEPGVRGKLCVELWDEYIRELNAKNE